MMNRSEYTANNTMRSGLTCKGLHSIEKKKSSISVARLMLLVIVAVAYIVIVYKLGA